MIKVAFLFDRSNDWILEHFPPEFDDLSKFEFHKTYIEESVRNFDIAFVLGYTKILTGEILSSNKSIFVVHESNLPEGKGFAPVQRQILEGKNEITFSLVEISEEVDSGDIVEQDVLVLNGTELYEEIRTKQALKTYEIIGKVLSDYPTLNKSPQVGQSSFYKKRAPKDSKLDIDRTIREQFQLLRVCNNDGWPAFFVLGGQKYVLKIYKEN